MSVTTTYKQVIVIRKDLNMRKGKMVAQGAHASMAAILKLARRQGSDLIIPLDARIEPWLTGRFTKICVSVNSEAELGNPRQGCGKRPGDLADIGRGSHGVRRCPDPYRRGGRA